MAETAITAPGGGEELIVACRAASIGASGC